MSGHESLPFPRSLWTRVCRLMRRGLVLVVYATRMDACVCYDLQKGVSEDRRLDVSIPIHIDYVDKDGRAPVAVSFDAIIALLDDMPAKF